MTTKTLFNMDSTLKRDLMRKAKKEGLTLTSVLNIAARAYVANRLKITALERDIEEGLDDIRNGRTRPMKEVFKGLGL